MTQWYLQQDYLINRIYYKSSIQEHIIHNDQVEFWYLLLCMIKGLDPLPSFSCCSTSDLEVEQRTNYKLFRHMKIAVLSQCKNNFIFKTEECKYKKRCIICYTEDDAIIETNDQLQIIKPAWRLSWESRKVQEDRVTSREIISLISKC